MIRACPRCSSPVELKALERASADDQRDTGAGVEAALESLARARDDAGDMREEEPAPAPSTENALATAATGLERTRSDARRSRPAAADTLVETLCASGISTRLANAIVDETVAHLLPFGFPSELKQMVRDRIDPDRDLGHIDRPHGPAAPHG